jgi:sarcosine oxidase subunit beta
VVGGGVVGCATAFFAARAGLRVVVLERRPRLATLTTPVSTGAFRLQFDNPEELALVREGVELFGDFAARTGLEGWDLGLRRQGYLFCSLTEESAQRARRLVKRQRAWGLDDVELLGGDEARRRFPYLSGAVRLARYRAGDGWLDPLALAQGYAAAATRGRAIPGAEERGEAVFVCETEATGFLGPKGDRVAGVRCTKGEMSAGSVVLATGPFLAETAALGGVRLELRPTIRHKLVFPVLPEVPADAPMTIEDESGVHWRPAFAGGLCLWTDASTAPSAPTESVPTDPRWAFRILDPGSPAALARVSPFWRSVWDRGAPGWLLTAGQYEMTPDRRPYLGPSGLPGLFLNGGYSGHGIMASAGGSRLVVDLLTGRGDAAANPFRVDRPLIERERDVL